MFSIGKWKILFMLLEIQLKIIFMQTINGDTIHALPLLYAEVMVGIETRLQEVYIPSRGLHCINASIRLFNQTQIWGAIRQ